MTDTNGPNDKAPRSEAETQAAAPQAPEMSADPLETARREAAELRDKLLRTLAEMENLRRRTEREVADARVYGIASFARDVLTVADSMERALQALDDELREKADVLVKGLLDGVELTERELLKTLERHGIKKIEPVGEKFDPNFHQAMYEVPDASVPAGHVVQVVQPGYTIGDRVLRPALVGVSKGVPKTSVETESNARGSDS
jgi:molecular chaperone GrpE